VCKSPVGDNLEKWLPVCKASERTEMAVIVQRCEGGGPQCTIFAVFEVKMEILD
jgi:hypothetical protein